MKEIFEALGTRLKSPLYGYSIFGFIAINWKPLFYMFASKTEATVRIQYFEDNTNGFSLLFGPIIFAVCMAIAYPWINLLFLFLSRFPTDHKNALQAISEHNLLLKKQQMEEVRSRVLSAKEQELIERAKRDQDLHSIDDEKIRNNLKKELEELRKERDDFAHDPTLKLDNYEDRMTQLIEVYQGIAEEAKTMNDAEKYHEYKRLAISIQEELAEKLRKSFGHETAK